MRVINLGTPQVMNNVEPNENLMKELLVDSAEAYTTYRDLWELSASINQQEIDITQPENKEVLDLLLEKRSAFLESCAALVYFTAMICSSIEVTDISGYIDAINSRLEEETNGSTEIS